MELQDRQARENRAEEQHKSGENRREPAAEQKVQAQILSRAVLRSGDAVFDLPPEQLERLASAVGNGAMTELLRGGGEKPETHAFTRFGSSEGEDEPNRIRTATPGLYGGGGIGIRDGPPAAAVNPRGLAERLTPGSMDLFGSL